MAFPLLDLINGVTTVIDRVVPDPKQKAQLQLEIAKLADQAQAREHDEMMGQIGTNTEEAKNSNMFVAGWRPAVGWICAAGAGYNFLLLPLATFVVRVAGYAGQLPSTDIANLMVLLTGMLGFGGLRSYEKKQGIQDSVIAPASQQPQNTVSNIVLPSVSVPQKRKGLRLPWPF